MNVLCINLNHNDIQMKYAHTHTHTLGGKQLDEGDACPDQSTSPIPHTRRPSLRPIPLHPRKRVLYVLRPKWCPSLRWG